MAIIDRYKLLRDARSGASQIKGRASILRNWGPDTISFREIQDSEDMMRGLFVQLVKPALDFPDHARLNADAAVFFDGLPADFRGALVTLRGSIVAFWQNYLTLYTSIQRDDFTVAAGQQYTMLQKSDLTPLGPDLNAIISAGTALE